MHNFEYLDSILSDGTEVIKIAEGFRAHSIEQFNYRPSGNWSAADCIAHLILINNRYSPIFAEIIKRNRETRNEIFKNSLLGKYIIKAVHPDTPRKVKTTLPFKPDVSKKGFSIIDNFLEQHCELVKYFEQFKNYNIRKIRITSPLSPLVKYNLGDACRIIINHDLRHLRQGERSIQQYNGA